jgi:hypothetical protein
LNRYINREDIVKFINAQRIKMAGTCKEKGNGSDAKEDDGRKTSFEMDGWMYQT